MIQRLHALQHGIGQVGVIQRRARAVLSAHDAAGVAHHRAALGHGFEHDGSRAHLDVAAQGDGPQHLCARADDHAAFHRGVALAVILARAAQGDALIERYVVAHLGGFANDHARAVVDEHTAANLCAGVNFNARLAAGARRYPARQQRVPVQV